METKRAAAPTMKRGLVRALVRRGTTDDMSPPAAKAMKGRPGSTMCERCGAIYRAKRWLHPGPEEAKWPVGVAWSECPACRQVASGEYFGRVSVHLGESGPRADEVRRRVENVAARAQWTQTQRRIVSIDARGRDLEILTTSQKLAHRIVRSLRSAFGGVAGYGWTGDDGELTATWRWDGPSSSRRAKAAPSVRRSSSRRGAVDLEIQSRHIDVDPLWRDLIERRVEGWAARHPELRRVHATLEHGRHRRGAERIALVANYPKRTLRVEKQGESMVDAIHAACLALGRELTRAQAGRRRIAKTPGARFEGSVARIFRDAGYGFVLLDRGREAYFHRGSVNGGLRFESLRPGTPVEVELEEGREGLQASRVFPVGARRNL